MECPLKPNRQININKNLNSSSSNTLGFSSSTEYNNRNEQMQNSNKIVSTIERVNSQSENSQNRLSDIMKGKN
jgi:hypothetical protein